MTRLLVLSAGLALACGGEPITTQLNEPVRAWGAQFVEGKLPGLPPLTIDEIVAQVPPQPPNVTAAEIVGNRLVPGEVDKGISGRVSPDSVSVGLRFADLGSGYWVVPAQAQDPLNNDERSWSADLSFSRDLPKGLHTLLVAALDTNERSGTQSSVDVCALPAVPDNRNACDSTIQPPVLVVSLEWDTAVDLDLKVVAPSGKVVDAKHPSTAERDDNGDVDPTLPGTGVLDGDSNRHCLVDGQRRENLVFQQEPAPGKYVVYANLYDACHESSVRFQVSLHSLVEGPEPGTFAVSETYRQAGESLAVHANGGKALGLFVTEFVVQ